MDLPHFYKPLVKFILMVLWGIKEIGLFSMLQTDIATESRIVNKSERQPGEM